MSPNLDTKTTWNALDSKMQVNPESPSKHTMTDLFSGLTQSPQKDIFSDCSSISSNDIIPSKTQNTTTDITEVWGQP
eukprot:4157575-Ditylum_brightwellii.AAC.1